MSVVSNIAEAVKVDLEVGSFSLPFIPTRTYRPQFKLKDMDTLHVTVVARSRTISPDSRSKYKNECVIDVAVQKRFSDDTNIILDPLMNLVDEICGHFVNRELDNYREAYWLTTENSPIYDASHMDEMRQFTSVISLIYRSMESIK